MSMHMQVAEGRQIVIQFENHLDPESIKECLEAYNRVPQAWWKDITVILDGLDSIDIGGLDLLLYLRERASDCELRLVNCQPGVARLLTHAAFPRYFRVTG